MAADDDGISRIVELPERDQAYWLLGSAVTGMISFMRDSDDSGRREFLRQLATELARAYETMPPAARVMFTRFARTYWLPEG